MAEYYVRRLRWGIELGEQFWCIDDKQACQLDVSSSSGHSRFLREPGDDVFNILERIAPGGDWHKLSNEPGEYFPRMARPSSTNTSSPGRNPDPSDEFRHYRARSTGQLHAFIEELDQIGRVIHPQGNNLRSYGHAIRNVLILACTEVEAHWKKILEENGYKNDKRNGRFDTTDYVRLLPAMRLERYVVNSNYYPWLPTITPFETWTENKPTKSLPWYHAYNLVKHDRDEHFAEATLERALTAVAASFVMLCAQYGWDFALQEKEADRAFFKLIEAPEWEPSEIYVPPFDRTYKARLYPFPPKQSVNSKDPS